MATWAATGRLRSRSRGVCQVVGQVDEERSDGDREPAGSTTRRRRRPDRIWNAGLSSAPGLSGWRYESARDDSAETDATPAT